MDNKKYTINHEIGDEDLDEVDAIQKGVKLHLKMNKLKGVPIARYDSKAKRPYLEYADGTRKYSDEINKV